MFAIVGVSFCCMIVGAAVGLEWADISDIGLALSALAATIFFSAIDAWECESGQSEKVDTPHATVAPAIKEWAHRLH